jgi:hypothetical protein
MPIPNLFKGPPNRLITSSTNRVLIQIIHSKSRANTCLKNLEKISKDICCKIIMKIIIQLNAIKIYRRHLTIVYYHSTEDSFSSPPPPPGPAQRMVEDYIVYQFSTNRSPRANSTLKNIEIITERHLLTKKF